MYILVAVEPVDFRKGIDGLAALCRTRLQVYRNDAETRGMSPSERLRFHEEHSGPVMERLQAWLQDQFDQKRVEPNSGLVRDDNYTCVGKVGNEGNLCLYKN